MTINPDSLYYGMAIELKAHDKTSLVGIRTISYSKNGNITGFNVGGSSFDLNGYCKVTPWVTLSIPMENP